MNEPEIKKGVSLKPFSTYRIGGEAKFFITAHSIEELQFAFSFAKKEGIPFLVIGKGSNCLFDDKGYNGLVVLNKIDFYEEKEGEFYVGGGFSFSLLGIRSAKERWSGLEFASGIPGSVGGAVYMNAGAGGAEAKDCLVSVEFLGEDGDLIVYKKEELTFRYRYSIFHEMKGAIVSARFQLVRSHDAKEIQIRLLNHRKNTQPYDLPSCGCVFRNPIQGSAGQWIERSGLKGLQRGGAEVSSKHANFIVNTGGATSRDVLELITYIRSQVKKVVGQDLESEVCYISYEGRNDSQV
jgi:UDP-N-acetylmuramate dehydrogenase